MSVYECIAGAMYDKNQSLHNLAIELPSTNNLTCNLDYRSMVLYSNTSIELMLTRRQTHNGTRNY